MWHSLIRLAQRSGRWKRKAIFLFFFAFYLRSIPTGTPLKTVAHLSFLSIFVSAFAHNSCWRMLYWASARDVETFSADNSDSDPYHLLDRFFACCQSQERPHQDFPWLWVWRWQYERLLLHAKSGFAHFWEALNFEPFKCWDFFVVFVHGICWFSLKKLYDCDGYLEGNITSGNKAVSLMDIFFFLGNRFLV